MARRALDRLYAAALVMAALALVAIAVLVLVQVAGRITDRSLIALGRPPAGIAITSLSELGGFLFVGAVFLGLSGTLRAAGHVRVTMLAGALPPAARRALTAVVLAGALGLAGFVLWSAALQAWDSWTFNAVSFGMARFPLWVPQGVMVLGLAVFWIAILDEFVVLLRGGTPAFLAEEADKGAGKETGKGAGDGH